MMPARKTLRERFEARVNKTDTCWLWTGHITPYGYGQLVNTIDYPKLFAHRVSLMLTGKTLLPSDVVDHICRVRHCVNPDHLRVVSAAVNAIENSISPAAKNKLKTHCNKGHEFTPENTAHVKTMNGTPARRCRECGRGWDKKHYYKQKSLNRCDGNSANMP